MKLDPQDILLAPIISEKSYDDSEHGKYRFKVHKMATKIQIKHAVEAVFGKKVAKVNISIQRGKKRRQGWKQGRTPDWKKAIVTLEGDERLDFFEKI
mgnify:FL=1